MDIPPCLAPIITKENNFNDFLFASLADIVLPKWGLPLRKKNFSKGNFFPVRVNPSWWGKQIWKWVTSPESVPIHLKVLNYFWYTCIFTCIISSVLTRFVFRCMSICKPVWSEQALLVRTKYWCRWTKQAMTDTVFGFSWSGHLGVCSMHIA